MEPDSAPEEHKRFTEWLKLKHKLHEDSHPQPLFKEWEVWWCSIGENVGTEINGKSTSFTRPILIFKKLDEKSFVGMPLSTSRKPGDWYAPINFQEKLGSVVICQVRILSVKRLYSKMGEMGNESRRAVTGTFYKFYIQETSQIFSPPESSPGGVVG